jgi:hypothetical protein
VQEFVRPLMGEDEKLFGCRETVQDLNTPASGGPTRAFQVIRRFDSNAACDDRCAQRYRLVAGIAGGLSDFGERLAIGLRKVLSRDSVIRAAASFRCTGQVLVGTVGDDRLRKCLGYVWGETRIAPSVHSRIRRAVSGAITAVASR